MLPVLWWDLESEQGIIKDGAKMVNAVSNSGSLNSRLSWVQEIMQCVVAIKINLPGQRQLAVMGGTQAAKVLTKSGVILKSGEVVDEAKEAAR
jgi:hypothetical protein